MENLDWEITGRLTSMPPKDMVDAIHDILTIRQLGDGIRKDLQNILSNHIVKEYMDERYPEPVEEKKPKRAPRKKKVASLGNEIPIITDAPVDCSAEPKKD